MRKDEIELIIDAAIYALLIVIIALAIFCTIAMVSSSSYVLGFITIVLWLVALATSIVMLFK